MSSVNVRISSDSYRILKSISRDKGQSMQSVVDQAIEDLRRRSVLEATNLAFAQLKGDEAAWKDEVEEREIWENALLDGLERE